MEGKVEGIKEIYFASVAGTYFDFSKLDLSPWGIQGGFIEKKETESFIKSISSHDMSDENWKHIKNISQKGYGSGMHADWETMNLLCPIDVDSPPSQDDYFEAVEAIRLAHPSEVYIYNIFDANYVKDIGISFSSWSTYDSFNWYKYSKPEDHYFNCIGEELEETNKFLALFKKRNPSRNYINNAIRYYSDSFNVNSPEMSFVCLCICLEAIVPGKEQLSFRFRRNLAVLCGESDVNSQHIYERAKNLYNYRSKLVHSGMSSKDFKQFDSFFKYAQFLASRMIIEMLLHDIPAIEELDKRVTGLGFGDGNLISAEYKALKPSIISWAKVSHYDF